ncbi:hypothetical protein L202_00113 [Cryptococcus amylolentus CBS 6039]|uniref:GH16 domain-containing protein n=2 Tax=Cryptococcus amylolentus TaxID=104669 RepID=A0A1E3I662_9TREE|nr:hypothetical protein L202_00113 [Cryptococcus amylolentus CBS 6039]ODN84099.1 hypothetical protein L202_00113 [Cryptococcus amylolentus CBS 6039]ODO12033.1 hypothetical protein I350_00817 [Cryptococcus amylolentus CBS 6273]
MLFSNTIIPILAAVPVISAIKFEPAHAKRAGLSHRDIAADLRRSDSPVAARNQNKRLVRKAKNKKRSCQAKFSASSTAASTASQTATGTASATAASASSTGSSNGTNSAATSSSWSLVEEWSGSNFFDNWSFWSYTDPTHGTVDYQSASDAWSSGLVAINSDNRAVMSVDTTEVVSTARKSVRIHGNKVFTGGLVIMDAYHMPVGCGTWPAWWQNGPNWPEGGEIDILEGVNAFDQNQVSLHTGVGCTMPNNIQDNMTATLTTGDYDSYDCSATDTSNQGCGARDETSDNSYGASFNSNKGGVYAMRWSKAGIAVWFFQRGSIPSDIDSNTPDPSSWGTPVANFVSDSCNPYQFFYDHFNIFDTTLCGDWAGADSVWNYAGYAGQSESCAASTGYSTCADYVLNKGSAFTEAYWEVASVKYFNSTTEV